MTAFAPFRPSIKTKITFITVAIFMASLWSLMLYISMVLRIDMKRQLSEQQYSAVSILAEQINSELVNRIRLLESSAMGMGPTILDSPIGVQTRLDESPAFQQFFNSGVTVLGRDGTILAKTSYIKGPAGQRLTDADQLIATLGEGKSSIGRPAMDNIIRLPVFAITVPIWDSEGRVIGALSGLTHLGPSNSLYQIAQNHYGKTGGFLLVAPRYRLIVTASNRARIMEILPPIGINPTIDRFINGYEGSTVFRDARGVEVLTSTVTTHPILECPAHAC